MTSDEPKLAEGHLHNLTPQQAAQLRKLWQTIFVLYNMFDTTGPINADPSKVEAQGTGWWARKGSAGAPVAKSTPDIQEALQIIAKDEQEQHRLQKQLQQLLAAQSPESVKKFKEGLADQPPEALEQMRDILAAQTPEQIKEYQKLLHGQSPQSIRTMVIGSVKHEHPDSLLLRFLRARKWDINKALVMMLKALLWRYQKARVDDIMFRGEGGMAEDEKNGDQAAKTLGHDFLKQIRMGKSFFHGTDRKDQPICVVRARLHRASDQCVESIERYTVYLIETGRFALNAPTENACLIFDLTGFTLANMDYTPVKFMIMCFEANYPESLGVILIHNAPWVFKACWRIIHGWLDPVIASKVHFTYNRQDLEKFIAPDQLIKELGGDEEWEYKYEEPVDGENAAMDDEESREQLVKEREEIAQRFEDVTKEWVLETNEGKAAELAAKRDQVADQVQQNYWKMDTLVRARSLYDRQGNLQGGDKVRWYDYKTNGNATADEVPA